MKYFKGEYWAMSNSVNEKTREKGDELWDINDKQYSEYIQTVENKLPKVFIKIYYDNHGFHDYHVKKIAIDCFEKSKFNISITLTHRADIFLLKYTGVIAINFDIPLNHDWMGGKMEWGYDEFELLENGIWEHRILCDFDCEFHIRFKTISAKKINKEK